MQAKLAQTTTDGQPPAAGAPVQQQIKKQNEILEVEFINKPIINQMGYERFVNMIGQCYRDEDEQNQEELVKGLSRDYMLWAKQAIEIMYSFKNIETFAKMAPLLMNRIADRHNRFAMVSHFPKA
jgi:hypothetical protein